MNFFQIIKRDLWFYWRSNLATLLLAAVCCGLLTGALLVGDCVRGSLKQIADMRLGKTQYVCATGDRFFDQNLAESLQTQPDSLVAPVLALKGMIESPDGQVRINNVNIYGITEAFLHLVELVPVEGVTVIIQPIKGPAYSSSVIDRLEKYDDDLLLRIQSPSALSRDMIFSTDEGSSKAWEIKGTGVFPDDMMGRFSLQVSQEAPLNVFVPIEWLAEKIGQEGKANLLLVRQESNQVDYAGLLKQSAKLSDYGLDLHAIESEGILELSTSRIFLDAPVADAAMEAGQNAYGVFTYFINEFQSGQKSVPYSTVSAVGSVEHELIPDLKPDEIVINEWLADELKADVGDVMSIRYYQVTDTRKLIEQTAEFTVKQVVPMMAPYADPTLMPAYPGLSEAGDCRDWESGIPIDLKKIRDEDEAYWDKYRGSPKAFVSLETAQKLWSNRFGTLTAVRFPAEENTQAEIEKQLLEKLDPASVGYVFNDVQSMAKKGAAGSTDFAGLFAGLSMFLVFSAAILLALIFVFYVESRSSQAGLFVAVGWGWMKIATLFLAEGAILALAGCILGAIGSTVYTKGLVWALNSTLWAQSLASLQLVFHAGTATLIQGIFVSFLICVFAIQAALYRRLRRTVHQLLSGTFERYDQKKRSSNTLWLWIGLGCLIVGILLPIQSDLKHLHASLFFMSGTLFLVGFFMLSVYGLGWLRFKSRSFAQSIGLLAIKNIPRRVGRSLVVLITLACGVFMVVGVGANYKDIGAGAQLRSSGTGGFALIAESTIPVTDKLQLEANPSLNMPAIAPDDVVMMRLYRQDEASCLNLNRAQQPSLLGVRPEDFASRKAFTFQSMIENDEIESGWQLLEHSEAENVIPAIGDYGTVIWGLGKSLGDTIDYRDETGIEIQLKIVGILKDSLQQGRLFISEDHFVRHFPSIDGYNQFLIDADWEQMYIQGRQLTRQYRDIGMEVVGADQRLAQFHEVENAYMAIFLVLGGFGLILGSAGLGLVLMLNVLDRKGEMAMMQAFGFRQGSLQMMLFVEHGLLLIAGAFCGLIPALLAVVPVMKTQGDGFPMGKIVLITLAILVSGIVWIGMATQIVTKSDYLDTLRNQ
ncbi:MAG: FtsX-like permease family protein [Planctomycetota bacterium]|jgi:ABC-type antimicrobial peptide transport system permease subunit